MSASDAVVSGDGANDLLGVALDPNVQIQESKAGSCDIRPGRRPQGEDLLRLIEEYQSRSGATVETDNVRITDPIRENWDVSDPVGRTDVGEPMGQLTGPTDPATMRLGRSQASQGLLHRHLDLHRMQGLRGGLQGVEPQPAGR